MNESHPTVTKEKTEIIEKSREQLFKLENLAKQYEQVDCPLVHRFAPGIYAREIFVPKDTIVVTKIHKQDHFTFVMEGECSVFCDGELKRIKAPYMLKTLKGTKRAVYVHEDTRWITVHHNPDDITDLEKIEDFVIAKNFDEIEAIETNEIMRLLEAKEVKT